MAVQITTDHLSFVVEAKKVFHEYPLMETYRNKEQTLIALRMGMDRDCIMVYELDEAVANFTSQLDPNPFPRTEVREFSFDMEKMLKVNDHKYGWKNEHHEFLSRQIARNFSALTDELKKEDKDKHEITIRCANIANYAMMISDNEGTSL
jgi:hypothetical protein